MVLVIPWCSTKLHHVTRSTSSVLILSHHKPTNLIKLNGYRISQFLFHKKINSPYVKLHVHKVMFFVAFFT